MIFIFTYLSNLSFSEIQDFSMHICSLPVIIYSNLQTDKSKILLDNKRKSGIYRWTHKDSGKSYIGSATDLAKRFNKYFSKTSINNIKGNSYIYNAITNHGYSAFSLEIIEYIDISNLPLKEARIKILEREQYYLDSFNPEYNILKIAGSSLGRTHSNETLAKLSEIMKGENHPFFGKTHSAETLVKISGKNNHFYGKIHLPEALIKMSEAKSGENHPFFGKTGENHPMFGKTHSAETLIKMSLARKGIIKTEEHKAKISKSMCKKVFVYSSATPTILSHEFMSYSEAANHFSCNIMTISKYIKNGKLFQGEWILLSLKK